jgi:two-component system sensor histidine kinase VicK
VTPFEARLRGAQGTEVDIAFHPCRTEVAGRVQLRLMGLDVTARREAERLVEQGLQLAESQRARMEAFLRGIGEPVVVTDPDGQVRLMNHAAEFSLGIDEPLAFGRDLLSEQIDSRFVEEWQRFLSGSSETHRAELVWGEGGTRIFEVTMSRVRTKAGRLAGCVCILRNATTERQAELQKQTFLANVTFELRASLQTIRGLVTAVARDGSVSADENRRGLDKIEREAARLTGRIGDLLALMRLDAGQDPVRCHPANLVRILEEVTERWMDTAAQRQIALELRTDIEGDGILDAEKLRRAVDRLISNAFRFTPRGGRIEVRADRDADRFLLAVADTGRGMDQETLQRTLDPFSTPSAGTLSGTPGLGMQLVRRLVTLHGGELTAESRPGAGTTFRLRFPVVPAEARAKERRNGGDPLVDDPLVDDPDPVEADQD